MKRFILATLLIGLGTAARSGTITLKDGTQLDGEITGEMDGAELIQTKYGSLTINKNDIVKQTPGETAAVSLSTQAPAQTKLTFKTIKPDTSTTQEIYYEGPAVIATGTFSASGALLGLAGAFKNGTYTQYYDSGALKTVKTILNGKTSGTFKAFFENGAVQTTAQYTNGVLDGPVTIRGETGILQFEQSFKNGVPDGWFRQYDSQGNIKSETLYVDGLVAENPKWTDQKPQPEKEPAKEPEDESMVTAKTQSLARGERVSFYLNNKYVARVNLDNDFNIVGKDGKAPDGTVKAYSKDGKLEKEFVFESDEVKILRVYGPGGALKAEYSYKEDKAVKK